MKFDRNHKITLNIGRLLYYLFIIYTKIKNYVYEKMNLFILTIKYEVRK